ncbi:MAG: N-6 DNA methylase [Flavobacterium nitrogenifigens]|uniref:Eco57I restriction-modification methylase domain-containing protein n=1 Tax=Flavobacterium nitrogenifigens TaxID=1617283 RepID=UPI002807FD19|nr:N-6 DNA methylase [Flavobacterium nitrogenifigens]MDQ8015168.1 N-6 DNA methylase [Flavobacterium nitrogenifigens]MDQ8052989.1 N-6 DNA methylase [Pedobacter sp.]
MQKELKHIINTYRENDNLINKIIVSVYLRNNSLSVKNNKLIASLLIQKDSTLDKIVSEVKGCFTIENVIEAFELAIPSADKVVNGAVYTPDYIKSFIVDSSIIKLSRPLDRILCADISCGCGAFLYTFANKLKAETGKSFDKIFKNNVFGLDINKSSINRAKILLSLLAISAGEDLEEFKFNLHTGNALDFDWKAKEKKVGKNQGFDLIIGNPPYVRAKNIDFASKLLLPKWKVTKSGNPDLYIPFFEIGMSILNNGGQLGYITVNSFYKSVNARELRRYFKESKYDVSIIDFGHERIFTGILAYTCICLISKKQSSSVKFKKENASTLIRSGLEGFNCIYYKDLDNHRGWLINDQLIIDNIKRIESAGISFGDRYKIRNGIATLSNDIYIFKPVSTIKKHYILETTGKKYKIEKAICRDIIKPNILKYEHEINSVKEQLIFPYIGGVNALSIIEEDELKKKFPGAYEYLLDNKIKLQKRDKGIGEYIAWYAFGRTQALTDSGYKLMFPYMAKSPHFVFTDDIDMLIYCGYAVFNESEQELKILKRILESSVFEYYIANTSKPYSSGYFSYAKNYVQNFGICDLNEEERHFLSNGVTKEQVNEFLIDKYQLVL